MAMKTSGILSIVALVLAALVGFAEMGYYLSHPYRHGVSPHLIGLSIAVVALAVAQILGRKE